MLYEVKHEWVVLGGVVGTAHIGRDGTPKDFRPGQPYATYERTLCLEPVREHRVGTPSLVLGAASRTVGPTGKDGYATVTYTGEYKGATVEHTEREYVGPEVVRPKYPSEIAREELTAILAGVDVPALWMSATHRQRGRALYAHREGKRLAALEALLTPLLPKELLSRASNSPRVVIEDNHDLCLAILEKLDGYHRAQLKLRKAAFLQLKKLMGADS